MIHFSESKFRHLQIFENSLNQLTFGRLFLQLLNCCSGDKKVHKMNAAHVECNGSLSNLENFKEEFKATSIQHKLTLLMLTIATFHKYSNLIDREWKFTQLFCLF